MHVIRHKKFQSGQKEICTIQNTLFMSFKERCCGKNLDSMHDFSTQSPCVEREDRREPDGRCALSGSEVCWRSLRVKSPVCDPFFSCVHSLCCFGALFICFTHLMNWACVTGLLYIFNLEHFLVWLAVTFRNNSTALTTLWSHIIPCVHVCISIWINFFLKTWILIFLPYALSLCEFRIMSKIVWFNKCDYLKLLVCF